MWLPPLDQFRERAMCWPLPTETTCLSVASRRSIVATLPAWVGTLLLQSIDMSVSSCGEPLSSSGDAGLVPLCGLAEATEQCGVTRQPLPHAGDDSAVVTPIIHATAGGAAETALGWSE